MKIFLTHVRSGVAKYAALPVAGLGVLVLLNRESFWIGIWPETGAAVAVSAFFMSLICAGISAWISARADVYGAREQAASAAIRQISLESNRFSANLVWLLSAYLLVILTAFVLTAISLFSPGVHLFFEYALLGLVLMVFSVAWGWFVGRILTPVVAGLAAALSWFIFVATIGQAANVAPSSGPPWINVASSVLVLRLATVVLFAVSVCALPPRSLSRLRFGRGVALTLISSLIVVVTHLSTTVLTPRAPVASPTCVKGKIEYCLWPEHLKYVPLIKQVDAQVAALPLSLELPPRVVDYSLSGIIKTSKDGTLVASEGSFDPEFDISDGSRWALARGVADAIVGQVFSKCDPQADADPSLIWDQLFAWLEWRLAGGGTPDYTTNAPSEIQKAWASGRKVASSLSDSEQAGWAVELIQKRKALYCYAP